MLSGYDNALYRHRLHDWRTIIFTTMTRGGMVRL
jgi:hypothetical protein